MVDLLNLVFLEVLVDLANRMFPVNLAILVNLVDQVNLVALGKNRPPPWRKVNSPPFFREKVRRIIFRLVSALFPGKGAEN